MIRSGEIITLNRVHINDLPVFSDAEASQFENKGWNLPQVWDLQFLKRVYNAIVESQPRSKEGLYFKLRAFQKPRRQIDEYWNALKCFGVVDYKKPEFLVLKRGLFTTGDDELSESDLSNLRDIFFSYFRFREISNWFLKNPTINESVINDISKQNLISSSFPFFGTSYHELVDKESGRIRKLTDTIFYEMCPTNVFQLKETQHKIMRFIDVYMNWGMKLNQIESLNLSDGINIVGRDSVDRKVKMYYFINDSAEIDIKEFIEKNYRESGRTIGLPELTVNMAFASRCSVRKIHREILSQTEGSNGMYSLQRTSKIFISKARDLNAFIRDREKLYPKLGNAFVSHLILR